MALLFAKPTQIAIRALVYLAAQKKGRLVSVDEIADSEGISRNHLATILRTLTVNRLVKSSRGPQGGYTLICDTARVNLWDLQSCFAEQFKFAKCALGEGECNEKNACPLHRSWSQMRAPIERYLKETHISDLARSADRRIGFPNRSVELLRMDPTRETRV